MKNNIILYNTEDGKAKIELHVENETVWLNQLEMAELFQTSKQNISKHIKAILEDGELDEVSRRKEYYSFFILYLKTGRNKRRENFFS